MLRLKKAGFAGFFVFEINIIMSIGWWE